MRWNATCSLIATEYTLDDEGVPQPTCTYTPVYCNKMHVGAKTWSSMYEIGISVDAILQVRSCDYSGQRDVLFDGKYYSVEVIEDTGDYTILTLRHQQSDSEEKPKQEQVEEEDLSA